MDDTTFINSRKIAQWKKTNIPGTTTDAEEKQADERR
jgi:hypothetical protein